MTVAVLGAGAWGTGLAVHLARCHDVRLWVRDPDQAQAMRRDRCNARYLPDIVLPDGIRIGSDLHACVDALGADGLVIAAMPVAGLGETLTGLSTIARQGGLRAPVVGVSKGFAAGLGELPHQLAASLLPELPFAVLSGPSFALEVALGLPCALVAASAEPEVRERVQKRFHHGAMRVYQSDDVIGVEVAGALKNVIALAAGICDGLSLGGNARAALVTRGLAETTRLGVALGAQPATFMGLAGVGDLMLTCTGALSRNRQVGLALASGESLATITARLGHVAEGVRCCDAVMARAAACGVDMPIAQAVQSVLQGRCLPLEAVSGLLARDAGSETG